MTSTNDTPEVRAIDDYTSNADLIEACARLGYIESPTLDCTYGLGVFWRRYRPDVLVGTDINPQKSMTGESVDFTSMPFDTEQFQTVVFDPPYKLNGQAGSHASDHRYGVDAASSWQDRHAMIYDGISECVRVLKPRGHLLIKCQDQVVAGRVRWQTHLFTAHAESLGCSLVDKLHLVGARPQPPGRRQIHARRNYSTLLVLERLSTPEPPILGD